MRVAVAIGALAVAEPVPNGFLPAPQTLTTVTGDTAQIAMCAFEGIGSQLGVVEGRDLERRGCVTHVTPALGLGEAKLTCMSVAMTAGALAGGAAVGRTATAQAILFGRSVTAVTCSFGVRARERPSAVVDAWGVPPALGVAVRATTRAHLRRKLLTMRVIVTVRTGRGTQLQVRAGALPSMAARARHGLMSPAERETCSGVLLHGEGRGPKAMLVVTTRAVGLAERAVMGVTVTVVALIELELPVSALQRQLWRVAALACDIPVHAFEGEDRFRVCAETDGARELQPTDAGMAALTAIAERSLVNLRMTRDAGRAGARRLHVASIVTGFALGFRVPPGEAQSGVVALDVGDLGPVGLVVTRCAFRAFKPVFVGICMAGSAIGLEPEERRVARPVGAIVAVLASNRRVSPFEPPTR